LSMYCRKFPSVLVLISLLAYPLSFEAHAGALENIQMKIAQFMKRPGVRSASWGIQILDPSASKVLLEVNPDKTFLPASVLKVITTSTALEKLGPDFRHRTSVYSNGVVDSDGTATGDLILVGRGDPNLTDPYNELLEKPAFQTLAEDLHAAGIRKVRGDIIGDDSFFKSQNANKAWTTSDLTSAYGAPITALSINNNVMWVHVRPTAVKKAATASLEPRNSYFQIRNLAITGSRRARKTINVHFVPGTNRIVISGTLPLNKDFSQYVVINRPAEVAAAMLKDELQKAGITVNGHISAIHEGDASSNERSEWKLLAEHKAPPLISALQIINKRSQNLHAEMLLRTLGAEFKGEGTDEAGLQVVKEFIVEAGIDSEKIKLNDGCGLSRENLITPRFQTSLLEFLSKRPYFDLFYNTLSVGGTDGTLRNRFSASEVKGSIHAKTGTLNGVNTLSGYMTTKSGRNLVFSIFANKVRTSARVKKTIDEICSLFVNLY
jgi:serine-type D-Ala-D-Ala carboxypeptidase/endopeptidase (penicillin-binding protein 4)